MEQYERHPTGKEKNNVRQKERKRERRETGRKREHPECGLIKTAGEKECRVTLPWQLMVKEDKKTKALPPPPRQAVGGGPHTQTHTQLSTKQLMPHNNFLTFVVLSEYVL